MNTRELIAAGAKFVAEIWNDDLDGDAKIEQASQNLYGWVEDNDHKLAGNLPGILGYMGPMAVDNPVVDQQQYKACVFAIEGAYQLIEGAADAYGDIVAQIDDVVADVASKLGLERAPTATDSDLPGSTQG